MDAPQDASNISIGVAVNGIGTGTKSTVTQITAGSPGEENYNENYLKRLDFFFYLDGSADDDGVDYLDNPLPSASAVHYIRKDNVGANTTYTLADVADRTVLDRIFAGGDRCIVYVIANYTGTFSGTEKRVYLRQLVAESNFNRVDSNQDGIAQESFVMEGSTEITRTLQAGRYYVSGTVPLYRSASKVRLKVTIPESVYCEDDGNGNDLRVRDGNGFIWVPYPEGMKAMLVHGVKKGIVCAMDDSYRYDFANTSDNYFAEESSNTLLDDYGHRMLLTTENKSGEETVSKSYEHTVPMYSYPTLDWKNTPANETHMTLVLPWKKLNDDGTVDKVTNTYYQIPIAVNPTDPTYQLKHNRYYRMEVTVGIIGSFELEDKVDLYPSTYIVLDWSTMNDDTFHSESNVNMSQTSYLAVATHRDTLNNVASHGVEYASSHPVTVTVEKIEYLNYKNKIVRMARITPDQPNRIYYYTQNATTGEWDVYQSYETSTGVYASYVANATTNEGYITLTHTIPASQYTPVNVYVNVSNGVVNDEEIIFTQYPPISIEGNLSNGVMFVNGTVNTADVTNVYTGNNQWIGSINARNDAASLTATGTNTNPMLYSIKISSFSTDEYVLGDPRVSTADNLLGNANTSWSTGTFYTYSLEEAQSFGSYTTENGTYYVDYGEYLRNPSLVTRTENTQNNQYTGIGNPSWANYPSEENAYFYNNYYYWRTPRGNGYTYHRARYSYSRRYRLTSSGVSNYYPTDPNGTSSMIAPEILIASSYGKTSYDNNGSDRDMTLARARMRCALYQEDGYPAGRWRLPTYSEVKFIMSLSTSGTIPTLFLMTTPTDTDGYWCANGKVVLRNNVVQLEPNNTTPTAPRCVYDLWYWGPEHDTYANTWHLGDND